MKILSDDPDRIPNGTAAAMDRHAETMAILARSRAARSLPLSDALRDTLPQNKDISNGS